MIEFIYILIKLIELSVFIIVGYNLSKLKSDKKYWQTAMPAIIAFALVDGLRYGRDVDYWGYLNMYNFMDATYSEGTDVLFLYIMRFFKECGLGFTALMVFQAAVLAFACFLMLKPYRKYASFAVPLLLTLLIGNENLTRWFMSTSFIIMAINQYYNKKYINLSLLLLASVLTHNAILPIIGILITLPLLDKFIIPKEIITIIFLYITLFGEITAASFVVDISNYVLESGFLDDSSTMATHMGNTEELINGEYLEMGITKKSAIQKFVYILLWLPILWYGHEYAKEEKLNAIYNIIAVSVTIAPLLGQVELLGRYTTSMNILTPIIAGIYYYKEFKKGFSIKFIIAMVSLFLFMYPTLGITFNRGTDKDMLFIWDYYSNINYF